MKQKKIKILFRTYGGNVMNRQTGLGHIFRSINLSYYLKHKADLHFLVEDYGGAKKIFNEYGFTQISSLRKNISLECDIKKTIQYIHNNNIDILIIDQHKTDIKYLKVLRRIVKTVIITDLKNTNLPVDILVNGFIGLKNQKLNTQILLPLEAMAKLLDINQG